jgi:acyl-CoA synthetase (NDP forming)
MVNPLSRLFKPNTIAIVGGGEWCYAVLKQAQKLGFSGKIYIVSRTKDVIGGINTYKTISELPSSPDATFLGINRGATIEAVKSLECINSGGAICFASGFEETKAEDKTGVTASKNLVLVSKEMPLLGPNCYGFINAVDKIAMWPDQHGCCPVDRGVAILTQSSNIAINITMQNRGLPIAYVVTCGNQAKVSQASIASFLLDDPRVTAIGFHIEGFKDTREWEKLSKKAIEKNIPLIAIKTGKTDQAKSATESHTASKAGNHLGSEAFLERLTITKLEDIPTFIETLKLLHCYGRLESNSVASVSCSGGEAALIADLGISAGLEFPPLDPKQLKNLRTALGPKVALANPLDYHTYIWRDEKAMENAWKAIIASQNSMTFFIIDYPRADRCSLIDWEIATKVIIRVKQKTGSNISVVSTLPELMPERTATELINSGIVPFNGLMEAVTATKASIRKYNDLPEPLLLSKLEGTPELVSESEVKKRLSEFGINVPKGIICNSIYEIPKCTAKLSFPLVVKALNLAHKTENNGVHLNCTSNLEVSQAANKVTKNSAFLIEEMQPKGFELLVGVHRNGDHGFILTIGVGGIYSELSNDQSSVLIPTSKDNLMAALEKLKIFKLLEGYRRLDGADLNSIIEAIWSLQAYVIQNSTKISEIEINPLICTKTRTVAVDALLMEAK